MSAPRPVYPGKFLLVTRRCTQRQFLLRPDPETNNAFVYAVAEAAERFEMVIVLSQMISNHHHTVVFDAKGNQVEFRQHLHRNVAKCQNAMRGRCENLWATEEVVVVEIAGRDELMATLVYVATNPVKHGLVAEVHYWPGPKFVRALLSGRPMRATRPRFYYSDAMMPAEVELALRLPEGFSDPEGFLLELQRRIAEVERRYAEERARSGRKVVGRYSVLRQPWRASAQTFEKRSVVRHRIAANDAAVRIALILRNREFVRSYAEARLNWLAGLSAVFPYGTYWLRRYANVTVGPPLLN